MLLERRLRGRLGVVVLENRFGVDNVDLADLLHGRIVEPCLEALLPRDAEPGRMSFDQPDGINLLVALVAEELRDRHDHLLEVRNVVAHADAGRGVVGRGGCRDARGRHLGFMEALHRLAEQYPVEGQRSGHLDALVNLELCSEQHALGLRLVIVDEDVAGPL